MRGVQGLGAAIILPGSALDRHEHVRRGRRAQQGARALGRRRRDRRDVRRARRRPAHPLRRLGVHLLSQRPDRGRRAAADPPDRAGEPPRHGPQTVRPARRAVGHRRAAAPRLHDLEGAGRRLGDGTHDLAPRRLRDPARRVRRDRGAGRGAADAAADLRAEDARGRERRRLPARRQLLRVHLRRDALHAAGPPLLGDRDRPRLARHVAHLRRVRRPVAGARHPALAEARDGARDGDDRRRPALDDARRGTGTTGRASSGRSSSPASARRSRSSRSRSPRSRASKSARPASRRASSTPPSSSAGRSASRSPPPSPPPT